uniref:Uncharacterized protein n=1 Tax=Anguilla anguilla TaxID=7936 RepID=A0A0E9XC05_ANGAN
MIAFVTLNGFRSLDKM